MLTLKGCFITIEGVEGAGKSTHARLLGDHLRARGLPVVLTREPGGTAIGQKIREVLLSLEHDAMDPVTELLLYAASRRQHLKEVILPAMKSGHVVISDRFSDSTRAYQGYGRGVSLSQIDAIDDIAAGGLKPGLTVLLDVEAGDGLERNRKAQKVDRLELEGLEFHGRVREGFLAIHRAEPERVRLVPSAGELMQVHQAIVEIVMAYLAPLL